MVLCLFLKLNCHKFLFLRKLENLFPSPFSDSLPQMSKLISEAAARRVLYKKVLLEILKKLQENTHTRVSATLFKKRLWHRCFPVNFAKFLGAPFSQNSSGGCFHQFLLKLSPDGRCSVS